MKRKQKVKVRTEKANDNFLKIILLVSSVVLIFLVWNFYFPKEPKSEDVKSAAITVYNQKASKFSLSWLIERLKSFFAKKTPPLKYENITDEQKRLLMTENGYYRRNGIKEILTKYFRK